MNSTISGNSANSAAAVANVSDYGAACMEITASTITSNTATHSAGGVTNASQVPFASVITLTHSILAGNRSEIGGDCVNNLGTIVQNGFNMIETDTGQCGKFYYVGDPSLGTLRDNGGPTFTHATFGGSPAINAIPIGSCVVFRDQRGVMRPIGSGCDIGAYEYGFMIDLPLIMK